MKKYLSYDEIKQLIGDIKIDDTFIPMSQDSYNETMIAQAIEKTGKKSELVHATINIAIVGIGNQRYGNYSIKDNIVDTATLLTQCGVKLRLPANSVLKEDDLTVGRLCRFFRHKIREYLESHDYPTYLWRKYSHHDKQFNKILFRGAEYLDDLTEEENNELAFVYESMDSRFNTTFLERFKRIKAAQSGRTFKFNE
jgi:hypothetical protein